MRLSRIEIENFKGIGTRQTIDLRPITLLFGANSAGKSTVLQALHYAREVLERGNVDPDQTIAGGLIDLGGFEALVHNHDRDRTISIKLTFDLSDDQGHERLPLNSGEGIDDPDLSNLHLRYLIGESVELDERTVVGSIAVELSVRWSEQNKAPYVARLGVDLAGARIAAIVSTAEPGRAQLTEFNFNHPLLWEIVDPEDAVEGDAPQALVAEGSDQNDDVDPFVSPLAHELWDLSREIRSAAAADRADESIYRLQQHAASNFRLGVNTSAGALPDFDRPLRCDLVEVDEAAIKGRFSAGATVRQISREEEARAEDEIRDEVRRRVGLTKFLDELILGPARAARDYLAKVTYVGPLREIPSRQYRPQISPDESRWAQGLAAWDLLYTDPSGELLMEVNAWLGGEERLKTGYRLEKFLFKEIPVPGRFHQLFDRGLTEDDLGELQDLYATLGGRSEVALRDSEKGIIVSAGDVGVGISQMIPVIVGCLRSQTGVFAVEQPELHVHPAVQVGLGDLFIHAIHGADAGFGPGKTLLVETHSEHIMLRLLRRIRETTQSELPPGVAGLSPDNLSVIYVESGDSGVRFRPLRVDAEGEFIDRWPRGFFEERAEELF